MVRSKRPLTEALHEIRARNIQSHAALRAKNIAPAPLPVKLPPTLTLRETTQYIGMTYTSLQRRVKRVNALDTPEQRSPFRQNEENVYLAETGAALKWCESFAHIPRHVSQIKQLKAIWERQTRVNNQISVPNETETAREVVVSSDVVVSSKDTEPLTSTREIGIHLGEPQIKNLRRLAARWECNTTEAIQRLLTIDAEWLRRFEQQVANDGSMKILIGLPPSVNKHLTDRARFLGNSTSDILLSYLKHVPQLRPLFALDLGVESLIEKV